MFRLNNNIRGSINRSLKPHNLSKDGEHWEYLLRYTLQNLMKHLEKYFLPGMTWKNYGDWHIDHIIPLSFFEFTNTDDVEFLYCWSLFNLQPMWAKDNFEKSDKLIPRYLKKQLSFF